MSTVKATVANIEFDAAQALLDLQSTIRETKHELHDGTGSVEAAKLFLGCFIASNVAIQPQALITPKVGTANPKYSVATSTTTEPGIATSAYVPKTETLSPRSRLNEAYPSEGCKRSKIFKRKPIKHFRVTSGPCPDIVANKTSDSNKNLIESNVSKSKVQTRDAQTQTEGEFQLPIIESMKSTIARLCETVKSLQAQIKSNSQYLEKMNEDNSESDNDYDDDDDESFKLDKNETSHVTSDSDLDETFTDGDTPEKVKSSKRKVSRGFNNITNVMNNRAVNANAQDMVPIGDGNAQIPSRIFRHINWNSYTSATRKLLTAVFSRRVLATHSLTGKPSPAFPNKPAKKRLDPALVNDIVQTVVERCSVPENVVRTSITTKCADESKMFRTRQDNSKKRKRKINTENIPPHSDSDDF